MATNTTTAAAPRGLGFDPWGPVWRLLTSVRAAVVYIALLALLGLAGTVIPQIPEAMRGNDAAVAAWVESQEGTFGPLTDPMHRLGFFNLFTTRWFLAALAFLVVFVTTCTFNRLAPTWRNVVRPPKSVPESFFERAHNRATLAAAAPERLTAALEAMRFRTETRRRDGATYVFADRFAWAQLGTFVSHLALILFLAGGLVSWATGFTASVFTGEGTSVPIFAVSNANQIQVRVDDAIGVYGDEGNPLDFRTHLTIFENGREVKAGVTTVNDPLEYGGYRFHQVAFFGDGAELRIREVATGNTVFLETFPMEEVTAAPRVTISDGARTLVSDVIAPTDFLGYASGTTVRVSPEQVLWVGITAKGEDAWQVVAFDPRAQSESAAARIDEGAEAALGALTVRFDGVEALPAAVGVQIPGSGDNEVLAQMVEGADGEESLLLVSQGKPAISLARGEPTVVDGYEYTFGGRREFAGISVKRDHGSWFIWAATAMLLIGLAITFYVPRRRLWIKITPERTQVAALAEKSGGFEKDMRILARRTGLPVPRELEEDD